jgi:hypothetical protein
MLPRIVLRHAVPIVAHFDWALAVTLSAPAASLAALVAPGLSLDTFEESGFLAVACVKTRRLRPRGFPARLGMDFFLAGYRLFVRFENAAGRRLRGLQILGSETERWPMVLGGRLFTHYGYRKVKTDAAWNGGAPRVATSSGLDIVTSAEQRLPAGSVFASWREARRFAGPMPFTFASTNGGTAIVSVEGARAHWEPRAVSVVAATVPFLSRLAPAAVPAAAFVVEDVDYEWKRGVLEPLP